MFWDNLSFSLNATVPLFLLMMAGLFLHKIGWMDQNAASYLNKFVFKVALPVSLFRQMAVSDFKSAWDTKFVLFCAFASLASVAVAALLSLLLRDRPLRGEFIQASYRSSASLLGVALIMNMYGTMGMAPLMIIGAVPVYNIVAVIVLMLTSVEGKFDTVVLKRTLRSILLNPIIDGIVVGFLWSALAIPLSPILDKTVKDIGSLATPLGLMAMGAMFDRKAALGNVKPALAALCLKLFAWEALFMPLAVLLGFRAEKLAAILVMLGSATTVSCYVMARNMRHEGTLTSSVVMLTTLASAFSLTFWIFLFRSLGYL